jgi:hypothetical protein
LISITAPNAARLNMQIKCKFASSPTSSIGSIFHFGLPPTIVYGSRQISAFRTVTSRRSILLVCELELLHNVIRSIEYSQSVLFTHSTFAIFAVSLECTLLAKDVTTLCLYRTRSAFLPGSAIANMKIREHWRAASDTDKTHRAYNRGCMHKDALLHSQIGRSWITRFMKMYPNIV